MKHKCRMYFNLNCNFNIYSMCISISIYKKHKKLFSNKIIDKLITTKSEIISEISENKTEILKTYILNFKRDEYKMEMINRAKQIALSCFGMSEKQLDMKDLENQLNEAIGDLQYKEFEIDI